LLVGAAGCPHRFQPSGETKLPTSGAPAARSRFDVARARFERAEYAGAREELDAIRHDFPDAPIEPYAALYGGMTAPRRGDDAGAAETLQSLVADEKAPPELRQRARFYLGLSDAALGKAAEARALLEPFADTVEGDD